MFARPIQFAAVLVVASSISTVAYASDSSLTPTTSSSASSSATAGVPSDQASVPSDQVNDPVTDQNNLSPTADDAPVETRQSVDLISGSGLSMTDSNLRASIVTTVLPSRSITISDKIHARTAVGAKLVAQKLNALSYSWTNAQMTCLTRLWVRESHWNFRASNRRSGAYGIPQASPGTKMASAGLDWRINPITQIKWGMSYVKSRYGNPCSALSKSNRYGWY